jgi:hypothetical protein
MGIFFLNWKKSLILIGFFITSLILYLAVRFLMDVDDPFSSLLAYIVVPLYFLIAILASLVYILIRIKESKHAFEESEEE